MAWVTVSVQLPHLISSSSPFMLTSHVLSQFVPDSCNPFPSALSPKAAKAVVALVLGKDSSCICESV